MMLHHDEGRRHLESVNVGVERVREPGASQAILVSPVVQLVVEIGVAGLHRELDHLLTEENRYE